MMSSEEGFSILRKMREESSPLYVHFTEGDKKETFLSVLREVTDDALILSKYEVGFFLLALDRIEFRYADTRESEQPERAGRIFDSCLELSWPNGTVCQLYVLRDDLGNQQICLDFTQ